MYPRIDNSPLSVLEAIERYSKNDCSLAEIQRALGLKGEQFTKTLDWYLCHVRIPFTLEQPECQTIVNIVLLQLFQSVLSELRAVNIALKSLQKKSHYHEKP